MKRLFFLVIPFLLFSCRSTQLLPSSYDESVYLFNSYETAMEAYAQIEPYETMEDELKDLGFDIKQGNNVEVMTYLDVSKMFLHNQAIEKNDLPLGIIECLKAQGECRAYKFIFESTRKERYGSFWADVADFRKKTHHTGWRFECVIIVANEIVVYSLQSGVPNIDKRDVKKQPLGPLQNFGPQDVIKNAY
jgi:hypothetical protein